MLSKLKTLKRYELFTTILSVGVITYLVLDMFLSDFFSWGMIVFLIVMVLIILFYSTRTYCMLSKNPHYYYVKPNYKESVFNVIVGLIFLIIGVFSFDSFPLITGVWFIFLFPLMSSRYILVGDNFLYSNITSGSKYNFHNLQEAKISEQNKYLVLKFEKKTVLIETFLDESKLQEIVNNVNEKNSKLVNQQ